MNQIKNIEIKNFKSIRHQTIDDCKRINVFIGYPNVGKSNILEALSLFSVDKDKFNLSEIIRFEKLTTFFFNGDISNRCEIILNETNRYTITFLKDFLRFLHEFDFAKIGFIALDENPGSTRDTVTNFELKEENPNVFNFRGIHQRPDSKLGAIKKFEFRNKIQFESGTYDSLNSPYGNNIFEIISTNEYLYKDVDALFEHYNLELIYDSRTREYQILKRVAKKGFTVPYNLIADTLRRLIFYKAAIASNKDNILLFEEPEAHMFPPYIKKLTTDVIFDKTNQFFITTHSPYVLDELILEAEDELSVYLVDYKDGETKIHHLSSGDLKEVREYGVDLFFNIESYLKHGQVNNA